MEKVKDLYPDTPPTVLRNRDEKFRTAKNIWFWHAIADFVFWRMFKFRFFSALIKGEENFKKLDPRFATIFCSPHTNWWDGALNYILRMRFMKGYKFRLMIEEMNRFPLFQYIGCFPINKRTAQTAMKSLQYCASMFEDPKVTYWFFPQGIIRPPGYRPIEFQSGLAYLVQHAAKNYGGINLVTVSSKYCFLREDKPEVVVRVYEPVVITNADFDRKEFTKKYEAEFETLCDNHEHEISSGNFEGYSYVFKRKLSWWKVIEKKLKNIGMKNAEAGVKRPTCKERSEGEPPRVAAKNN